MPDFISPSLLVPPLRNDLNMRALETLCARLGDIDISAVVLYDFDAVDASVLPHLAEQFNVLGEAGWDIADTDEKKRALLKEAVALHRIKGTPYALKRALELLGINATVTEWWQAIPKGTPHTFVIRANVTDQPSGTQAIDAKRTTQIKRIVNFWKPARSHFNLELGLGMATSLRTASVFSGVQCIFSAGSMLPFDVSSSTGLRSASVLGVTQVLVGSGKIK